MCGCGRPLESRSGNRRSVPEIQGDCSYTIELMEIWKIKLKCIQNNDLFLELNVTKYKVNFALGTVQSALNTGNCCLFARQLDEVNDIILALINIGKCQ